MLIPQLEKYFQKYGWEYELIENPLGLISGFVDSQEKQHSLFVSVSEFYINFTLPYITLPSDEHISAQILCKLMTLSFDWALIKLSLDNDKNLYLSVEHLQKGFDYTHFELSLDLLTEAIELLVTS
jgi:hypothetical protein